MNKKYKKYKTKENLFYTDETSSENRSNDNNYSLLIKEKILENNIKLKGEKKWFNKFRINNFNINNSLLIDIIIFTIISFILMIFFIIYKK